MLNWNNLIDSVGGIIDNLHTSGAEKLVAKQKMVEEVNRLKVSAMKHEQALEKELSERHKNDSMSDSWLSKNIRPLGLVFVLANLFGIAWASMFTDVDVSMLQVWVPMLTGLAGTMVTFYYGSRGWEKIQAMRLKKQKVEEDDK